MTVAIFIGIFLLATIKFQVTVLGTIWTTNLTLFEVFYSSCLGGFIGVLVFYLSSAKLSAYSKKKIAEKEAQLIAQGKSVKIKKKFTRKNKIILKIKHRFGKWGLMLITPSVISIPIGSIITYKFYRHEKSTLWQLLLSVVINSVVLIAIGAIIKVAIYGEAIRFF